MKTKLVRIDDELKRLFPADGSTPPWRVADQALYAMTPKDRLCVLRLYCAKCGERNRLDINYDPLPCACP